jgi:hypothetical protein
LLPPPELREASPTTPGSKHVRASLTAVGNNSLNTRSTLTAAGETI